MLIKIFEFIIDVATLIFIIGASIAVGRMFSMFTERIGMYLREKLPDKVYLAISIIFTLLIIALALYEVIVD